MVLLSVNKYFSSNRSLLKSLKSSEWSILSYWCRSLLKLVRQLVQLSAHFMVMLHCCVFVTHLVTFILIQLLIALNFCSVEKYVLWVFVMYFIYLCLLNA